MQYSMRSETRGHAAGVSARNTASIFGYLVAALTFLLFLGTPSVHGADDLTRNRQSALNAFFNEAPEFLPVDEAFVHTAWITADGELVASWEMPPGYYLYRHRLAFELGDASAPAQSLDGALAEPRIPAGKAKFDEYFGDVEVYYDALEVRVAIAELPADVRALRFGVSYQGCADAGLCYPPETRWHEISLPSGFVAAGTAARSVTIAGDDMSGSPPLAMTEGQRLGQLLSSGALLPTVLFFLLAGIGLAFTPCVLPMVPILSSIIVGEQNNMSEGTSGGNLTRMRAFALSFAYVTGMALTYAVLGVLMGFFGASLNLQASLQSPAVLSVFAAVFVLLSLAMFGFYELRLPVAVEQRLHTLSARLTGGKLGSVAVMGALSALVVSPCVSAPLAAALLHISSTGDALLGGAALLALGFGMGIPLIIVGVSGGALLPKAGAWMESVKNVFGVLLIGVAIWLLERVLPGSVVLLLWAALAIGCGVFLGALDFERRVGWNQLWKASGAFAFCYGVLLLIGAASGAQDPFRPLQALVNGAGDAASAGGSAQHAELVFEKVESLAELQSAVTLATDRGQPVLVDFYADWCISCKVMERSVFSQAEIAGQMRQFLLVKADVTDNADEHRALLDHFGLVGPPGFVFFDRGGVELDRYRLMGELHAEEFAGHLDGVLTNL